MALQVTPRTYSDDEVREILRLAIEREASDPSGLGRDDLLHAAAELGIATEAIDRAIAQVEHDRVLDAEITALRAERRRSFLSHATTWVIVCTALLGLDVLDGGGFWFYWPLFGWGIAVALDARSALLTDRAALRAAAEGRLAKRAKQRERAARRERRARVEQEVEAAVEQGVSALLEVAKQAGAGLEAGAGDRRPVAGRPRSRVKLADAAGDAAGEPTDDTFDDAARREFEDVPRRQ